MAWNRVNSPSVINARAMLPHRLRPASRAPSWWDACLRIGTSSPRWLKGYGVIWATCPKVRIDPPTPRRLCAASAFGTILKLLRGEALVEQSFRNYLDVSCCAVDRRRAGVVFVQHPPIRERNGLIASTTKSGNSSCTESLPSGNTTVRMLATDANASISARERDGV